MDREDATTFPFMSLPKELRLTVYEYLHEIRPKTFRTKDPRYDGYSLRVYLLPGHTAPTAILQVSKTVTAEVNHVTATLNNYSPTIFCAFDMFYIDVLGRILSAWKHGREKHMAAIEQRGESGDAARLLPRSIFEFVFNEVVNVCDPDKVSYKSNTATSYFYTCRSRQGATEENIIRRWGNHTFDDDSYNQILVKFRTDHKIDVIITDVSAENPLYDKRCGDLVGLLLRKVEANLHFWIKRLDKESRMKMTIRLMGACDYAHAYFVKCHEEGTLGWGKEFREWLDWEIASEDEREVVKRILGRRTE